jgi:putative hydrolase of the HAD superfamily
MPLAAVLLDFGGTLVREVPSRAEIHAEEARRAGLIVSVEAMRASLERAHASLPREVEGAFRYSEAWFRAFQRQVFVHELGLPPERLDALSARLFARFESARTFELYPGARALLAALRARGLCLGLVSNWSTRLPRLLAALGLGPAFDFVLCSAEERLEKPERALFARAVARAGAPAEHCLHAGDRLDLDVRGAQAAGLSAVLVDHAGRAGPAERAVCPVVGSLAELQDLILARA